MKNEQTGDSFSQVRIEDFEAAVNESKIAFDPVSSSYVEVTDRSCVAFDPKLERNVFVRDKSKIVFDPFTNMYVYVGTCEKSEFDPFTNTYDTVPKSKPAQENRPKNPFKKLINHIKNIKK